MGATCLTFHMSTSQAQYGHGFLGRWNFLIWIVTSIVLWLRPTRRCKMLWLVYFQLLCFCSGIWFPHYVVDRPNISDAVLWEDNSGVWKDFGITKGACDQNVIRYKFKEPCKWTLGHKYFKRACSVIMMAESIIQCSGLLWQCGEASSKPTESQIYCKSHLEYVISCFMW